MNRAYCVIREQPHYRHEAFWAGLKVSGFKVHNHLPSEPPAPGDIIVIWNRYGANEPAAEKWEAQGGTVLVAENGYIGRDAAGLQHYALAVHGHNGSGRWPAGDGARWAALGIELKPWRASGTHILVCGQRGIGSKEMASPTGWHDNAARRLRAHTKRPIRIRLHPGKDAPDRPLAEDLADAWACVIWSSSSGVQALTRGIPVIYDAPHWSCAGAATREFSAVENPPTSDSARLAAFERLAWAQWTVDEIASGEPFGRLLA